MFNSITSKLNHLPCPSHFTCEKKVALVSLIMGIALSILTLLAFLHPFTGGLSFFNFSVTKIIVVSMAGIFVIGPVLYFTIKRALHLCLKQKAATDSNHTTSSPVQTDAETSPQTKEQIPKPPAANHQVEVPQEYKVAVADSNQKDKYRSNWQPAPESKSQQYLGRMKLTSQKYFRNMSPQLTQMAAADSKHTTSSLVQTTDAQTSSSKQKGKYRSNWQPTPESKSQKYLRRMKLKSQKYLRNMGPQLTQMAAADSKHTTSSLVQTNAETSPQTKEQIPKLQAANHQVEIPQEYLEAEVQQVRNKFGEYLASWSAPPILEAACGLLNKKLGTKHNSCNIDWKHAENQLKKWGTKAYTFTAGHPAAIRWVTGTRSAALIGMSQSVKKGLVPSPSLIPTKPLIDQNIVPFTGELSYGIEPGQVNTIALSGTSFSTCSVAYNYAHNDSFRFQQQNELDYILDFDIKRSVGSISRLKIAVLRLIHSGTSRTFLLQARSHIQNNILPKMKEEPKGWETPARLIGSLSKQAPIPTGTNPLQHPLPRGTLVGVKDKAGETRLAMIAEYDEKDEEYLLILDQEVVNERVEKKYVKTTQLDIYDQKALSLQANRLPPLSKKCLETIKRTLSTVLECREDIQSIITLFDTEKALPFSKQEKAFLDNPFPIIWGTTSKNLEFCRVRSNVPEMGYKGILEIGKEIDVVFTKSKQIVTVQRWLKEHNINSVKVMSLGTLAYLRALSGED